MLHSFEFLQPLWPYSKRTGKHDLTYQRTTIISGISDSRKLKYLLILDFEATCSAPITLRTQEIIEFPTLVYNLETQKIEATFHEYVRPVNFPTLTAFCTELTGIEQVGQRYLAAPGRI